MGAGRAGSKATPRLYRDVGHDEIPARGPLAALTVPGAIAAWKLAGEAAKAQGGKLPLDVLLAGAIKHAREGYSVTRSQARLTVEKYAELETAPGFLQTFLVDGKAPEAGAKLKQSAFAATLEHLSHAGLDDFYRGDVGREIAADLERIGSPVTRADLEKFEAFVAEPLSVRTQAGTLYNTPPPTQGLASLIILALFDRLRVSQAESFEHIHGLVEATKRAFRVRDRVVTDPDKITADLSQFLSPAFLDAEADKIDAQKGRALAGAARRRRHHLDGRGGCVRPRRFLHPVALLGIRLRLRAAGDRRPDAEPRRELLARPQGAQRAGARPPPVPHAQSGARRAQGRPRHRLRHHGRRRPAADASHRVHPPRHVRPAARQGARRAALAARAHLGLARILICRLESRFDGNLVDRLIAAGHDVAVLDEAYSDTMGHAGAVVLHPDGTLEGGHDPRADGGAAGI